MTSSCLKLIDNLSKSVDQVNNQVINNMTDPDVKYDWVCIKPDVTYEYFYDQLKRDWESQINDFINRPDKCNSLITSVLPLYQMLQENYNVKNLQDLRHINLEQLIFDVIYSKIMNPTTTSYHLSPNLMESMSSLIRILSEHCYCQAIDIFQTVLSKYQSKYLPKLEQAQKEDVIRIIKEDYQAFRQFLSQTKSSDLKEYQKDLTEDISQKFTQAYLPKGFSVQGELNRLIPDELGSLKDFFVKVISTYYNNLHPVVWAQIAKQMMDNIFIELPYNKDQVFQFVSKYALLNSGPFILKILQMIRPILTPELATKYNLTKLTYPVLEPDQVNLILGKVVKDWNMYKVIRNVSASVGNVSIVYRVDKPRDVFVIKVIKPIAVAQSCWEYKTLYNLFEPGTCEQQFVENMLESNGRELNVQNEIKNIHDGFENYTATYPEVFGVDIDAKLTTIQVKEGVVDPNSWFSLAMTLAPGIPLAYLIENDLIKHDTKYRAKLHRCLDLLVYKFFLTIVKNGFYHGDLHSGNIFFSYEHNQMTLIDFGAVGRINLFEDNPDVRGLLEIIVMSIFYDYDDIFDKMTTLLNSKCLNSPNNIIIDQNDPEYQSFKEELKQIRILSVKHHDIEEQKQEQYKNDIFSEKRIKEEQKATCTEKPALYPLESIYTYLKVPPMKKEAIIENKDELPVFTEIMGDSEIPTFSKVLEMIIKFYASHGVNIAIKFNDFYEFQKAYALLLGVLHKVDYNSYRMSIALHKAIVNWQNVPKLFKLDTVKDVYSIYSEQKKEFDQLKEQAGPSNIEGAVQHGGSGYRKYLKYKTRYLQLKNLKN